MGGLTRIRSCVRNKTGFRLCNYLCGGEGMAEREVSVKVLERMFMILDCFSIESPLLSISDIHQRTGLNKSTIYRILASLCNHGYMMQDEASQQYRLGFKFFDLGAVFLNQLDIRRIAIPIMRELREKTGETVNLNVEDKGERVCIELLESPHEIRNFVQIGQRNELYLGASGKVLLAFMDDEEKKAGVFEAAAKHGVDLRRLREDLTLIRKQGYCVSWGERAAGSWAVSAPVYDQRGKVIAGLTVSGPQMRMTQERLPGIVRVVVEGAQTLSERMGYSVNVRKTLALEGLFRE